MRFKVFCLRRRGRRLAWRDVRNGPSYVGDLLSRYVDHGGYRYHVLTLTSAAPMEEPLLELYEPALLTMAPLAFRVRGFERVNVGQGYTVLQEWHVEPP